MFFETKGLVCKRLCISGLGITNVIGCAGLHANHIFLRSKSRGNLTTYVAEFCRLSTIFRNPQ